MIHFVVDERLPYEVPRVLVDCSAVDDVGDSTAGRHNQAAPPGFAGTLRFESLPLMLPDLPSGDSCSPQQRISERLRTTARREMSLNGSRNQMECRTERRCDVFSGSSGHW